MIKETTLQWMAGLKRRIEQYLIFEDREEEHAEKMAVLSGREKIQYELEVLGDFFSSEYYNADFDPWPDEKTRIDTIEELLALADNDLERKKLENQVNALFEKEHQPEVERSPLDSSQDAFFQMMTQAFGVNSEYEKFEQSMTEISETIKGEESGTEEEPDGSDSLRDRLAEVLDDHMDSF